MITAGWRRGDSSKAARFKDRVGERVVDITKQAIKIKGVMWEGILSAHLDVVSMGYGTPFISKSMEDAHEVPGGGHGLEDANSGPIICTTALGLSYRTWKPVSLGSEKEEWKSEVILKPKVLLEATLSL